ncbi:FAD-dependent oxidoreductase [Gemella sp. Musashino-2025]
MLLSPGGVAVKPQFEGIELKNIHTFRGPEDTQAVADCMKNSKKAVVVGGGYIGLEVAESYAKAGIEVTIVDFAPRILNTYLDKELTDILTAEGEKHNLTIRGEEKVLSFKGENGKVRSVVTDKGKYPADTVIISVGVRPDASWLGGELELTERGFVVTDEYLETSAKDVFAGGDSTLLPYSPTGGKLPIALATLARRQGVVAALNALGKKVKMPAVNGTSALSFFDYNFVSTGLSSKGINLYNGNIASKYVKEKLYPDFMRKENNLIHMKIYYDNDTHRILGAQLMSKHDITDGIAAISIAISSNWTLEELALADIFFQPEFDRPWHYINVLAMAALDYKWGGADKLLF